MKADELEAGTWFGYGALLLLGAAFYVISARFPAHLPVFLPWEFHWPEFLILTLTLAWFARGLTLVAEPPPLWRRICFVVGVISFYVVLQTRVDYYAQHLFFMHRWAHFVLHHAGAFAIAMGMSGETVYAGLPDFIKLLVNNRPVRGAGGFSAASRSLRRWPCSWGCSISG